MKHFLLILILVTQIQNLFAQDTLVFHSGQKKSAHVLEINPTDIKYTRYGTETPLYILNVKEVFYIKYPNGIIDTLSKTSLKELNIKTQQLHIVDSRIFNSKGPLRESTLQKLLYNYPNPVAKELLITKYKYLGRQDKLQIIALLSGIGTGYVGLNLAGSIQNRDAIAPIAIIGTAIIGTSIYFFIRSHQNLKRTKKEIVELYNNNL